MGKHSALNNTSDSSLLRPHQGPRCNIEEPKLIPPGSCMFGPHGAWPRRLSPVLVRSGLLRVVLLVVLLVVPPVGVLSRRAEARVQTRSLTISIIGFSHMFRPNHQLFWLANWPASWPMGRPNHQLLGWWFGRPNRQPAKERGR